MNTYIKQNPNQSINVGVDTGKSQLDIYIRPLDLFFSVSNDGKGIQEAVSVIKKHKPERIVIEATGRLEMPFIMACAKAKLPFVIANPIHIKRFAAPLANEPKRIVRRQINRALWRSHQTCLI